MKKICVLMILAVVVFCFTVSAQALLINRGTDSLGNRLIYDDHLNITWYDNSKSYYAGFWSIQNDWALALTIDFEGTIYDDWRLPTSLNQDGSGPCIDLYCTDSEMGHLRYTELQLGITGNTSPFEHLLRQHYWSGTELAGSLNQAWYFNFNTGRQSFFYKYGENYAMAVRSGDVAAVPEPATMILLGSGLLGLGAFRKKFRK